MKSERGNYEKMARAVISFGLHAGASEGKVVEALKRLKARLLHLEKGDVIARRGDPAKIFALVLKGHIRMTLTVSTGEPLLMKEIGAGELAGHSLLVKEHARVPCDVTAGSPCTLIAFDFEAARAWRSQPSSSGFARVIEDQLARALMKLWHRGAIVSHFSIGDRVLDYLRIRSAEEGTREIRIPQNIGNLAAYLACARPALSRAVSRLCDQGLVARKGRGCLVLLEEPVAKRRKKEN